MLYTKHFAMLLVIQCRHEYTGKCLCFAEQVPEHGDAGLTGLRVFDGFHLEA